MVPQKRTLSPKEIMNVMNLQILKISIKKKASSKMDFKSKTNPGPKRKGLVPRKKPLQSYGLSGKPWLRMGKAK